MPDYDFKGTRLAVEAPLGQDAAFEATGQQANYLLNVLRLDTGNEILVFNGRDGEWRARLERTGKKHLQLVPVERTRAQTPNSDLHYLFAPLKSARLDYMIQKGVEMGAGVLQPVMTQHTQAPRFNAERAQANAVEAAEQCGILSLPECREMVKLDRILVDWDPTRRLVFCDERASDANPLEALGRLKGSPLAVLVGPEGGFSAGERETLLGLPFVLPIAIGPRILRADTAAVAALAIVQAAAGDWT